MKIAECSHIRIRDGNVYGMNVERMIKHYEELYQIDFRTLPQWKQLVHRMHLAITDCKRKIGDSKRRKATIIDKLCIESCRPSPFELTNDLVRTAKIWEKINADLKTKKRSFINLTEFEQNSSPQEMNYAEIPGEESPGHPNSRITEMVTSMEPEVGKEEHSTIVDTRLPTYVCTNQHKRISRLGSTNSVLSVVDSGTGATSIKYDKMPDEWLVLRQSTKIISTPNTITIENQSLKEQSLSFSLVNCSYEYPYLNLRFKGVTHRTPFKRGRIHPATPVKLFAGIPVNFKFIFKLEQNKEDFASNLFFRVGQNVLAEAPIEGFSIPIISSFTKDPSTIYVSEEVNIRPSYFWHVNAKSGFPTGELIINVPDNQCYDLHIAKLNISITQDSENDIYSIEPTTLSSGTMLQREQDQEVIAQTKPFVTSTESLADTESVLIANFLALLLQDVIQQALDVFVFEKTYLRLKPFSNNSIKVFQTKAEHIGFHQNVFELELTDPVTGETVSRKTIKVFGNVLPNPIQIYPNLLDMTKSPIVQGRCEDYFTIINSHKTFPVSVKIKLPAKIKKLVRITPTKTFIPASSTIKCMVGFCSRDLNKTLREDLVHATLEIIVTGDQSVYRNLPPIYYEILAPFSSELEQLCKYNTYQVLNE